MKDDSAKTGLDRLLRERLGTVIAAEDGHAVVALGPGTYNTADIDRAVDAARGSPGALTVVPGKSGGWGFEGKEFPCVCGARARPSKFEWYNGFVDWKIVCDGCGARTAACSDEEAEDGLLHKDWEFVQERKRKLQEAKSNKPQHDFSDPYLRGTCVRCGAKSPGDPCAKEPLPREQIIARHERVVLFNMRQMAGDMGEPPARPRVRWEPAPNGLGSVIDGPMAKRRGP